MDLIVKNKLGTLGKASYGLQEYLTDKWIDRGKADVKAFSFEALKEWF